MKFKKKTNGFIKSFLDEEIFDSLRSDYKEFDDWYNRSIDDDKKQSFYWINNSTNKLEAFLGLKKEKEKLVLDNKEVLSEKDRIKITTIKSTNNISGFSEFVIYQVLHAAIKSKISEIYFSVIPNTQEKQKLLEIAKTYGFIEVGKSMNNSTGTIKRENEEVYLLKTLPDKYDKNKSSKENYPLYEFDESHLMVIEEQYHDNYLPDATLQGKETSFIATKMGIKKALVHNQPAWLSVKENGLILIYRKANTLAKYNSAITSVGRYVRTLEKGRDYKNFDEFKKYAKHYHAFGKEEELQDWYNKNKYLTIFEYLQSFGKGKNKYNWVTITDTFGSDNLNCRKMTKENTEKIIKESLCAK